MPAEDEDGNTAGQPGLVAGADEPAAVTGERRPLGLSGVPGRCRQVVPAVGTGGAVPRRPPGQERLQHGQVTCAAGADIGGGHRRGPPRPGRAGGVNGAHRDSGEGVDERVVNKAFLLPAVLCPGANDRCDPVPAYCRGEVDVGIDGMGAGGPYGKRPGCRDDREQHHGAGRHPRGRPGRPHHGRTRPVRRRDARDGRHRGPHRQAPRRRHGGSADSDVDPVGRVPNRRGRDHQRAEAGQRSGQGELKQAGARVEAMTGEEDHDEHGPGGRGERAGERPRVRPGPRPPDRDLREAQHTSEDTEQHGRPDHDRAVRQEGEALRGWRRCVSWHGHAVLSRSGLATTPAISANVTFRFHDALPVAVSGSA